MSASGFMAKAQVCELTTLSATTLWRLVKAGRFPKPKQISPGRVAWPRHAVDRWLQDHGGADNATS